MSARPKPRKSTLTQHNPVDPAPQAVQPSAPPVVEKAPVIEEAPKRKVRPSAPESKPVASPVPSEAVVETPKPKTKPKVSFYQDAASTARARGAMFHTAVHEGARTWSEFLDHAVMREVERLEREYNDGKPFPSMGAGALPQGRPMGR